MLSSAPRGCLVTTEHPMLSACSNEGQEKVALGQWQEDRGGDASVCYITPNNQKLLTPGVTVLINSERCKESKRPEKVPLYYLTEATQDRIMCMCNSSELSLKAVSSSLPLSAV